MLMTHSLVFFSMSNVVAPVTDDASQDRRLEIDHHVPTTLVIDVSAAGRWRL